MLLSKQEGRSRLKSGTLLAKRDSRQSHQRKQNSTNNPSRLYRHYRKSIGALIVYDITKEQSFMSVRKWIEEVREHAEPEIVIMLVGNKLDLCE